MSKFVNVNSDNAKYLASFFKDRELEVNCGTKEAYFERKEKVIAELKNILGFNLMHKTELNPQITETVEFDTYTRERIIINTQEHLAMPFYKMTPKQGNNIPVIAVHGHGADGKYALAGIYREGSNSVERATDYTYALEAVKRGYTVFAPDLMGFGDRKMTDDINKTECTDINNVCISVGISLLGIHCFDMLSLIDYIEKYSQTNVNKLVCMGFSGGAIVSLFTASLSQKVFFTAVSGYFHGFKGTMFNSNFCGCNFVPNMWNKIDMGDVAALIAPNYLYIETGREDTLNGEGILENVYPQLDAAKKAYNLFGAEDNVTFKIFNGSHNWYGGCYDLIDECMK